jgi:hypothetical protein
MKRGIVFGIVFLLGFVCASYNFENHSIENYYDSSSNINGWINISFNEEPTNSIFSDSFGNDISLIELLKSNRNITYSCNPNNCESDYLTFDGRTNAPFDLNVGDEIILGFLINGAVKDISSVDFIVESNAGRSCYNQLKFDFGLDGVIEAGNSKPSIEACSFLRNYGCFDENVGMEEYIIGKFPNKHCQRVNLSESAGFNIGAWINPESDSRNLSMAIYETSGVSIDGANCELKNVNTKGEYFCSIDYLVSQQKEFYVCIYSENEGVSKIRGYSDSNGCGFYGPNTQIESASFQIFAEGRKFDSINIMNITNTLESGNILSEEIKNYITDKYNGFNCSSGCVIPFKIHSSVNQNINLKNLKFRYETNLGQNIADKFYKIQESPASVNMDTQKVYLNNASFIVPYEKGAYDFTLKFENNSLFSENISIKELTKPKYLIPTRTASVFPTSFSVIIAGPNSTEINSYTWDFGDNTTEITTTNKVTHTYEEIGIYEMKISIRDPLNNSRIASEKFRITVTSPKGLVESHIDSLKEDIEKIDKKIKTMDLFHQTSIKRIIDIEDISDKFKEIQKDYLTATTDEEYNTLAKRLIEIRIPQDLVTSKKAENIPFFPLSSTINLDILKKIAGGDYGTDKTEYIEAVRTWQQMNLNIIMNFEEISGIYEDHQESLLSIFKLNIKSKGDLDSDPYIIIKNMSSLMFKENYLEEEESGYFVIDMKDSEKSIEFSTEENIEFLNLPLFVSPSLEKIELITLPSERNIHMNWTWVIIIVLIILIFSIGIYIFLHEWYKRKYESYLFGRRNDLYNLLVYIKDAKEKGMNEKEIKAKLRSHGWNREQIDYAIKKYLGKKIGMLGLPVNTFSSIKKTDKR